LTIAAFGLVACGSSAPAPREGTVGFVSGFIGGVVADEPRAVLAARDVLSSGGTAADAAVALYFTLAVTKPAQAGLGGGGVCVVYSWRTKQTEALDFLPPIRAGEGVVPGNVRGMLALQARDGKLRWETLVGTAERLARNGTTTSRSTARDLAAATQIIAADPGLKAHFMGRDGSIPREGNLLAQPELAGTLSTIRRAPQEFYTGPFAHVYAAAATEAGQRITPEAMRAYAPSWTTPAAAPFGSYTMYFPPNATGNMAAAAWTSLGTQGGYEGAANRNAALVAAIPTPPGDTPSPETSFAVADRDGDMIGCTVTMNRFFGSGRMARGTGVVPAAPDPGGRVGGLAPMMATNPAVPRPYFVGAASGGAAGTRGLIETALGVFSLGQPLDVAIAAGRPDSTGLVNAIYCLRGINPLGTGEQSEAICQLAADKRGFGLAQHD
jgi:gamma-glutamyltranspeptidase/glutathione hydrolase